MTELIVNMVNLCSESTSQPLRHLRVYLILFTNDSSEDMNNYKPLDSSLVWSLNKVFSEELKALRTLYYQLFMDQYCPPFKLVKVPEHSVIRAVG